MKDLSSGPLLAQAEKAKVCVYICVCAYVCVYCVCASVYCVCGVNKVRDFSEGTVEQYENKTLYVYVSM